jgi:Tol biopolymer transport system component
MVTGLRSQTDDLQDPTLTSDELEIFFLSVTNGMSDIWKSQRATATAPWGAASLVAELSSPSRDEDPSLSRDGLTIYLSSDRVEAGTMRLWFSRRSARDQPWAPPEQILTLGTSTQDVAATVDASGLRMVFASERDNLNYHLFASVRPDLSAAWGAAESLATVNSEWQDRDPALFNQGNDLVFSSRRTGQGRTSDLFHIARPDPTAAFAGAAVPLPELNSDAWEGDPWLSEDGRHILFVSDRTGTPRIYEARR